MQLLCHLQITFFLRQENEFCIERNNNDYVDNFISIRGCK